jgi:predicted alpha/beta superfamily hydrolase
MKTISNCCRILVLFLLCLFAAAGLSGEDRDKKQPVSLPKTETLTIKPKDSELSYQLHVALPDEAGTPGRTFPVIYLLDSDIHFGFVRSLIGSLHLSGDLEAVILVGIGYGEGNLAQWSRNRDRDFLVAALPGPTPGDSGNASRFLALLRSEIIPRIESGFPVRNGDRTLMGMSAGAIFASHVLVTSPDLFRRYVIVSPYLIAGQEKVVEEEIVAAKGRKDLEARVYTALGNPELEVAGPNWNALFGNLVLRQYPRLTLRKDVISGLSLFEIPFSAYLQGIKYVFGGRPAPLQAVAGNYPAMRGRYFFSLGGATIPVTMEGGKLFVHLGPSPVELVPISRTRFAATGFRGMEFSFLPGENARSRALILGQMGFDSAAWRMEEGK